MAESRDNMKVKMPLSSVSFYLFIFTLLDVAVKSQMSSNSNSHYIQDNSDVRYLVDNIPVSVHKEFSNNPGVRVQSGKDSIAVYSSNGNSESSSSTSTSATSTSSSSGTTQTSRSNSASGTTSSSSLAHLKFEPSLLDFKERHLGMPHHEKVTILNLDRNKTIHMTSISGSTVHFHSSFFEDKMIPPLGNTSFNVVFLGREEGNVESCLFIHTSEGTFKYNVKGASIQSPYRLRPLSGVRLPLNASYSPLIRMHNPHSTAIQLVEVYSSGGEFHLELPSGELEGPKHLWEIPAFLTKPVIRVRFHARAQKNYTAYIRLKVNNSEEVLVVPLEVEVSSSAGLYCPDDIIDFGIGGSQDPPKQMKLMIRNSWKKPIKITNVMSTPVSKSLRIDFEPIKVPPDVTSSTHVATLTFDWKAGLESGIMSGRIVVKSKHGNQKLVIPYTATVLIGGLSFDQNITFFRSDLIESYTEPRVFHITNNYKVPIAITNVTLVNDGIVSSYFQLSNFEPTILKPNEKRNIVELSVKNGVTLPPDLRLDSKMLVLTNISTLSVPIKCFNGRLEAVIHSSGNATELHLGVVGSSSVKESIIALINSNPVPVKIVSWGTNIPGGRISLISYMPGNKTTFLATDWSKNTDHTAIFQSMINSRDMHSEAQIVVTSGSVVRPRHYAVFNLEVLTGKSLGVFTGTIWILTEYEGIKVQCNLEVQHGSLVVEPNPIVFKNCFPGKICLEPLTVRSRFAVDMMVTGVTNLPADRRFSYTASSPLVAPSSTSHLGLLSWDAEEGIISYLGISNNTVGWVQPDPGSTNDLPSYTKETDLNLLRERYNVYLNVSSRPIDLSLRLDTTHVRDLKMKATVKLSWPRLLHDREYGVVNFPLTQIGNISLEEITIVNPSTRHPLLLQLVLENSYPMANGIMKDIPEELKPACPDCPSGMNMNEFFLGIKLASGDSNLLLNSSPIFTSSSLPPIQHSLVLSKRDISVKIPPSSNVSFTLGFLPATSQQSSTLLFIRNNLTVLEVVRLTGVSAFAQFKFGNRKPGSTTPLLFELADKHLKDCEREKHRKYPAPNLTVKRSFTARNTGALPIKVQGFEISGLPCEGYGFRVLNCEPFYLLPNMTRKVDIAFTPDFTLARVQRTLSIRINNDPNSAANYSLVATLPPYLLASCSSVLARPTWEPLLYYSAVTFMIFLLVCVLAAAFLESDRVLKHALMAMSQDSSVQPVLDLRLIAGGFSSPPPVSSSSSWCGSEQFKASEAESSMKKKLSSSASNSISGSSANKRNSDSFTSLSNSNTDSSNLGLLSSSSSIDSSSSLSPLSSSSQRRGSWSNLLSRSCQHVQQLNPSNSSHHQQKNHTTSNNINLSNNNNNNNVINSASSYLKHKSSNDTNLFTNNSGGCNNEIFQTSSHTHGTGSNNNNVSQQKMSSSTATGVPVVPILRTCDFSLLNNSSNQTSSSTKKNKFNSSFSSSSSTSVTNNNSSNNNKYKKNCLGSTQNNTTNGNKRSSDVCSSNNVLNEDADSSSTTDSSSSHEDYEKEDGLKSHTDSRHRLHTNNVKYNNKQNRSNRSNGSNSNNTDIVNKKTDKNNLRSTVSREGTGNMPWLEVDEEENAIVHSTASQIQMVLSSSLPTSNSVFTGNSNKKSHNNRNGRKNSNSVRMNKNNLPTADIGSVQGLQNTAGIHHSNKTQLNLSGSANGSLNRINNSAGGNGSNSKTSGVVGNGGHINSTGGGRNKDKSTPVKRKPACSDKNTSSLLLGSGNNATSSLPQSKEMYNTVSPPTVRASFSDVVARTGIGAVSSLRLPTSSLCSSSPSCPSVASLSATPLSPLSVSSDNMNVNTMSTSSGLGPIGPKKPGRDLLWLDQQLGSPTLSSSSSSSSSSSLNSNLFGLEPKPMTNSLPQGQNISTAGCNSVWTDTIIDPPHSVSTTGGSIMSNSGGSMSACNTSSEKLNSICPSTSSLVLKVLQEAELRQQQQQQQNQQSQSTYKEMWPSVNSLWEPPSLYLPPSTTTSQQPLSAVGSSVCSMWGSDVWAPPSTPWAPPGLSPHPQHTANTSTTSTSINSDINEALEYHPFRSLSNIWSPSPSSTNIWQPPTTK